MEFSQVSSCSPSTLHSKGRVPVGKSRGINNLNIAYELHGTGPHKIVFVMGLNVSMGGWKHQVSYFGSKKEYQALILDNRGCGWSDSVLMRNSTYHMAHDVVDVLDYLGFTEDRSLSVVGISMGGMIVQELALQIPNRIVALCLSATCAKRQQSESFIADTIMWLNILNPFQSDAARFARTKQSIYNARWLEQPDEISNFNTNSERVAVDLAERNRITKPSSLSGLGLQLLAVMTHNVTQERLRKMGAEIPDILAITGLDDKLMNADYSATLAKQIPCELVTFPDVGHAISAQIPKKYNEAVEELIGRGIQRWNIRSFHAKRQQVQSTPSYGSGYQKGQ